MAESKFFEVQAESYAQLSLVNPDQRKELIELYLESLKAQNKNLPAELVVELIESNFSKYSLWLEQLTKHDERKFFRRVQFIKIQLAEKQGKLDELYKLMSDYQLYLYEIKAPSFPEIIQTYIEKYFKNDFQLRLQALALYLSLGDLVTSEVLIKELILSCVERSSPKGIKEKIASLKAVLFASELSGVEIYKNYCSIFVNGVQDKKDYKKLAEIIIYTDAFKLQVLILDILFRENLTKEVISYASAIKKHADYDYIYLDKFFSHLKPYFFQIKKNEIKKSEAKFDIDLTLDPKFKEATMISSYLGEKVDDEKLLEHVLKYQDYSVNELLEIAVSFLQSELPQVALTASEMALKKTENDLDYLKVSYLKLTTLLLLGDYRAALDVSLDALGKSQKQDDVLSFMYGQAEAYLKLKEVKQAKSILKKIVSIDSNYRMAKERLERINEI